MTHMNRWSLLLVALAGLGMTGVISLCQVRGASEEAPGAKGGATKPAASPANEPLAGPDKLLADARAKLNSSPGAKNIVAALLQDTKFEFIETPFSEFVAKISERHGIPIRIDEQKWLADLGIERIDLPVTRKLNGLSLHSSLQLVLSDLASTYVIRDDTLMITSVQESRRLAQQGAIHADDVKRELERSPTFRRKKAKIVGDLEDLTQMDFQAMPLGKAIDSIRNRRGTAIEIDVRELDDVGIRDDVPCTLSVKGVKLAAALDKLLGELGLTYVVEGEYILVTARKKASPAKDNGKAAAPADPASAPGSRGAAASANLETGKPAPLWF